MPDSLSVSDKRHLQLIKQYIVDYREEKRNLSQFLGDILLYDCLDAVDDDWKQDFFNQWARLEETYAGVLSDFNNGKLKFYDFRRDEDVLTILDTMENLVKMVASV